MQIKTLSNGSLLIEDNNVVVLDMHTVEGSSNTVVICTDPIRNSVLHVDWRDRWCFIDQDLADILVRKGYADYAKAGDIEVIKKYLEDVR